jgi:hypothetical protein
MGWRLMTPTLNGVTRKKADPTAEQASVALAMLSYL